MARRRGPIQVDVTADVYPHEVLGALPTDELVEELMKRCQQEPGATQEIVDSLKLPLPLREQVFTYLNQPVADHKVLERWKQAVYDAAAAQGRADA